MAAMSDSRPRITLHVVSSLDGFIARHDNDVSWLDLPADAYEKGISSADVAEEVLASIDCYVLGSRTYEHALELGWPYGDTPTIVVTRRDLPRARDSVELYAGDLEGLVKERLAQRFDSVWLVGGAELCQSFLALDLVDEIRLSVAPVLLGDGLRLFGDSDSEKRWRLLDATAYKSGIVELAYGRERLD